MQVLVTFGTYMIGSLELLFIDPHEIMKWETCSFKFEVLECFFKKLKEGNSHSLSTIQSSIQSHTWIELNPHSYLLTFWAWSNIVAFWEMSWSMSTLVIHCARSSIKSIKSGSPEALHPPEKRKKWQKWVSLQSYSSKKKG